MLVFILCRPWEVPLVVKGKRLPEGDGLASVVALVSDLPTILKSRVCGHLGFRSASNPQFAI